MGIGSIFPTTTHPWCVQKASTTATCQTSTVDPDLDPIQALTLKPFPNRPRQELRPRFSGATSYTTTGDPLMTNERSALTLMTNEGLTPRTP